MSRAGRREHERLRYHVDGLDAVLWEADAATLRFTYVSGGVARLLGDDPSAWLEDPDAFAVRLDPEDRDRVLAAFDAAAATEARIDLECRARRDDGSIVRLHVTGRAAREGGTAVLRGLMVEARGLGAVEEAREDAEERYRALIEQVPAIVYVQSLSRGDGPGPMLYLSSHLERVLGYRPDAWLREPAAWAEAIHPDDRDRVREMSDEAIRSGRPFSVRYRMLAEDGGIVWLQDDAVLVRDQRGAPLYWQGVMLDVTEAHLAEERAREAERLERDLALEREISRELRALDEIKTTFLRAVSHDLRTPLAAILGLAITLGREDLVLAPPDVRELADRIAHNARRLDRLVSDLLDLDTTGRGVLEPDLADTDLGELVRRIVDESGVSAERSVEVDAGEIHLRVDAPKVERIVENLLVNTTRHTPVDTRVWVSLVPVEDGVELRVQDDGPGIPEEEREVIFEPFRRGSGGEDAGGVGIGLALVARFAELHGGRAWVTEREGGGASFRVLLPVEPPAQPTGSGSDEGTSAPSESQE